MYIGSVPCNIRVHATLLLSEQVVKFAAYTRARHGFK